MTQEVYFAHKNICVRVAMFPYRVIQIGLASILILLSLWATAQDTGLSLDALMGGSSSAEAAASSIMDGSGSLDAAAPSLDLDTIHAGRAIVQQRNAYSNLQSFDRNIASQCNCTTNNSCFDLSAGLQYEQVISAANEAETSLSDSMQTICQSWPGAGQAAQSMSAIETRMEIADKILLAINQVDGSAAEVRSQLTQQENRMRQAIAQQQEAANPGFNWGQFTAMTVGVVAGGIGNLDASQQAEILSSITLDSMNGGGSMSSFQGTMDSLNAELATMQSQIQVDVPSGWQAYDVNAPINDLALETQMINQAAEDLAHTMMGEQVDISNRSYASQASVPDASSLLQGLGGGSNTASVSSLSGSANGFDPAMRPGGATNYDLVGNSSGIQGSSTANSVGSGEGYINETYTFTCPGGSTASFPIITTTRVCAEAMKRYARVYSCNLYEEFEAVEREMNSLCADDIFE